MPNEGGVAPRRRMVVVARSLVARQWPAFAVVSGGDLGGHWVY